MLETDRKYSLLDQEYIAFINELVAQAVEPPITAFQERTSEKFKGSIGGLLQARDHLLKQAAELEGKIEKRLSPTLKQLNHARGELSEATMQIQSAQSELSALRPELGALRAALIERIDSSTRAVNQRWAESVTQSRKTNRLLAISIVIGGLILVVLASLIFLVLNLAGRPGI
ncbi:MAG TPA: hypothetical protein VJ302_13045 [Blastocatellia bacterium]|nr:hypothetical protein [Blastocatellia bacterium]